MWDSRKSRCGEYRFRFKDVKVKVTAAMKLIPSSICRESSKGPCWAFYSTDTLIDVDATSVDLALQLKSESFPTAFPTIKLMLFH